MLSMTLTWVICGAGRRVGKTHLAQQLCAILPKSVYAKHGCSRRKAGKPPNFFRSETELAAFLDGCHGKYGHVVVESNGLARQGQGDIIIFVDGIPGQTDYRADAALLRSRAHIRVGPGASIRDWRRVLRRKLTRPALAGAVCDLLVDQQRFLSRTGPRVRTKVWLVADGMHAFGSGVARLLEAVDQCGTLREAARAARMSYRHAWDLIRNAEKHLGNPLIIPHAGGRGGGRTSLSPYGKHMLDMFQQLNRDVAAFAERRAAPSIERAATRATRRSRSKT
jgi:molybdate transport system regulatory protein